MNNETLSEVKNMIKEDSVLIDKEGLSNLYDSVLKIAGFGLGGILYSGGKKAGEKGASAMKEKLGLEGEDLIGAMVVAFEAGNWGNMSVEKKGEEYEVTVKENILIQSLEKTRKKPSCYPLAGYIAGFFELATGNKVQVKEVECQGAGGESCRFQVKIG